MQFAPASAVWRTQVGPPFFSRPARVLRSTLFDSVSFVNTMHIYVEDTEKEHVVSLPGNVAPDRQDAAPQRRHVERVFGDE